MTLKLTYGKAFLVLTDYAERTHQLPFPERMKDLPKNFLNKAQNKKQENLLKESLNIVIDHQKNKNSKDVIKDVRKKNTYPILLGVQGTKEALVEVLNNTENLLKEMANNDIAIDLFEQLLDYFKVRK